MIEGEWLGMIDDARAELSRYRAGQPYMQQVRQACHEIERLAEHVKPSEVVETVLALYLMAEQDPRRFRSDDAFRFQLARRVRALTDVNRGTWYDHTSRRVKRVYRDTAPRTSDYLGQLLCEHLGPAGLYVARLEQALSEAKKEKAKALWENLEKLE